MRYDVKIVTKQEHSLAVDALNPFAAQARALEQISDGRDAEKFEIEQGVNGG